MGNETFGDFLRERHKEMELWPWPKEAIKRMKKSIKTKPKKIKY